MYRYLPPPRPQLDRKNLQNFTASFIWFFFAALARRLAVAAARLIWTSCSGVSTLYVVEAAAPPPAFAGVGMAIKLMRVSG